MASVVQLFTRRGTTEQPSGAVAVEAGSYGTARVSGSFSGRTHGFDYAVGGARLAADNRVPNSEFDNNSISANAGAQLGAGATLRFIGRGEFARNGSPGQTAFGRPDLDAFAKRHDMLAGVVFDQQLTPSIRQHAIYALAASNQQSTNLHADPDYTPKYQNRAAPFAFSDFLYDSRTDLRRHHASYQADIRLANAAAAGSQLLTVLADWDGERAALRDRLANTVGQPSRDNVGLSLQQQAVWRRVVARGSVRFEHNASFGNAAVPRASLVVVARDGSGAVGSTRAHVSGGLGIKEPTLLQSFSPSPFFRGNPDLEPERSRSVEVGVDQRFAFDRAKVAVAWFSNRYKNLIATRTTNPATFEAQYFNIGLTQARGVEFTIEAAPVDPLRVRAGYTRLDSRIVESTSPSNALFTPGQPLFRRPRHSGFAEFSWSRDAFAATVTGVFIGRFVDSDFSSLDPALLENPGFTTWDARFSYALLRRLTALLSIDNLAGADYMEPLGYQALGRAVRAGLRVGF
jgi:outer membrane cobalamin receptor